MENINWYEALPSYLPQELIEKIISPMSLVWTLSFLVLSFVLLYIVIKIVQLLVYSQIRYIFLEVRPTDRVAKSALSTTQLFAILHSLEKPKSFIHKILKIHKTVSYELVSTKDEGIRYILRVPKSDSTNIKKTLRAYLAGIEIREIEDYLNKQSNNLFTQLTQVIQSQSYLYPLQDQSQLTLHDPIAYLTSHMTKMAQDEMVAIQCIATPVTEYVHSNIFNQVAQIKQSFLDGKDVSKYISNNQYYVSYLAQKIIDISLFLVLSPITLIGWVFTNGTEPFPAWVFERSSKSLKEVGKNKLDLYSQINEKISQQLFVVSIKIFGQARSKTELKNRINGIASSFESFSTPHQHLVSKRALIPFVSKLQLRARLTIISKSIILSAKEFASIYHLPFMETTKVEDVIQVKSPKLPAPLSLKKSTTHLDIEFAKNTHGESLVPIGLTLEERRRHTYILGATGTGKTTLLLHMIHQDMEKGNGIAIIDPHGDLSEKLIGIVPKHRIKDVVYLNPYDIEYPIGINVLELPKDLSPVEEQREKDFITSTLISIFHKLYDPKYSGPRMEHILRNVILTALEQDNPTLFTIYKLLTDKDYRKKAVSLLDDEVLKAFWKNEFEKLGSFQKAEQISPITNKLGRFLTTSMTRNILNQTESKLNFDTIMNQKKILICNLAKGKIGEDTAYFMGSLITAKIQLSALRRVHIPEKDRSDFFLYIDEFQNFATQSFAEILSEARKYRLSVILAHQNTVQIENDLLETIIGNTGTLMCFRTSSPQDENKLLPVFAPEVEKGQIANLPSYNFYMKINALQPQATFSGEIDDFIVTTNENTREEVISHSRDTYGQLFTKSVSKAKQQKVIVEPTKKNNEEEINRPPSIFEKIKNGL